MGKDYNSFNKTRLSGSRSPFRDTKSSFGKDVNTSPFRRFSPQRSTRYESPRTLGKSYLSPERRVERAERIERELNTLSPLRRARSPLRSPIRSPLRRYKSPLRSYETRYYDAYTDLRSKYLSLEEETFVAYLKDLVDIENNIERAKRDLILRTDFNVDDAFGIFELDRRGYLSELDLKYGLHALDIIPSESEINLLFKRFDLRNQGAVSFDDFFVVFSPVDREYRRTLENRLPSYYRSYLKTEIFSVSTKLSLKDFLNLLLKYEARVEGWRQRLKNLVRFNCREFFEKIDRSGKNFVSVADVKYK
jgi:hypothetical protein